jgi:hypothetical protein
MTAGAEGYDPIKLFQPYVSGTMASWDLFQKMLTGAANLSGGATGAKPESTPPTRNK